MTIVSECKGADLGEARRSQILLAAAECFKKEGFQGTSMSRISVAAKMSVGHLYHYFKNKEAIIEAIAAQQCEKRCNMMSQFDVPENADFVDLLAKEIVASVMDEIQSGHTTLMLEITAEATRNQSVAKALRVCDLTVLQRFSAFIHEHGQSYLEHCDDEEEIHARVYAFAAMMLGLSSLLSHGVVLSEETLYQMVRQFIVTTLRIKPS